MPYNQTMSTKRNISFSPPDISEEDIAAVSDVLRSGWITTGPLTKQFEEELTVFCGSERTACFSSATAALECCLRVLGIGPGDEVITSAYTYTSSCSVICHVGATPVLCDTAPNSYEMDYDALPELITPRTKAIIAVDIAGVICNYKRLFQVSEKACALWNPSTELQRCFSRIPIIADAAHSLGALRRGRRAGRIADFTAFSFHAVKNLTTAEGGALTWRDNGFDSEDLYQTLMQLSLHGQTKDALSKAQAGAWEYDIAFPGWKYNMTNIQAALGLSQLKRYPSLLVRRKEIIDRYNQGLADLPLDILDHHGENFTSSGHLMLVRLTGKNEAFRNALIEYLGEHGIASNVHYKPLPLFTAYKNLGFDIADYPNAFAQYQNEITLPLHTLLENDDIDYIVEHFIAGYKNLANNLTDGATQ